MFSTADFTKGAAAAGVPDSCTPPATTFGTDTMSVYIPETTTYTIWTRLQAPSASANSILLNIDGTNCYNVGGDSSIPTNGTWDWVDDYGSDTSNIINLNLTQGTHTFTLTGTESGVSIDRIIAVQGNASCDGSASCTPTNTQAATAGNNLAPIANTPSAPPVVSVTAPTASSTVKGTTTISATATDPGATDTNGLGIASVQFELNNSPLGSAVESPASGNTYTYSWDTSSLGTTAPTSYSISAIATDTSGYTTTTGATSVTVNNVPGSSSGGPSTPTLQLSDFPNATSGILSTAVSLSWPASSDSGGTLTGYHLYRSTSGGASTLLASPTGTSYIDSCLAPDTSYSYTITAYDASHASASSAALVTKTESQIGDLDGDNTVTGHDLSMFIGHYATNWPAGEFDCTNPTLSTNVVEGHDMSIMIGNLNGK